MKISSDDGLPWIQIVNQFFYENGFSLYGLNHKLHTVNDTVLSEPASVYDVPRTVCVCYRVAIWEITASSSKLIEYKMDVFLQTNVTISVVPLLSFQK